MSKPGSLSRRQLLRRAAAVAATATAARYALTSGALAQPGRRGANDRINVGCIGVAVSSDVPAENPELSSDSRVIVFRVRRL